MEKERDEESSDPQPPIELDFSYDPSFVFIGYGSRTGKEAFSPVIFHLLESDQ